MNNFKSIKCTKVQPFWWIYSTLYFPNPSQHKPTPLNIVPLYYCRYLILFHEPHSTSFLSTSICTMLHSNSFCFPNTTSLIYCFTFYYILSYSILSFPILFHSIFHSMLSFSFQFYVILFHLD